MQLACWCCLSVDFGNLWRKLTSVPRTRLLIIHFLPNTVALDLHHSRRILHTPPFTILPLDNCLTTELAFPPFPLKDGNDAAVSIQAGAHLRCIVPARRGPVDTR